MEKNLFTKIVGIEERFFSSPSAGRNRHTTEGQNRVKDVIDMRKFTSVEEDLGG